MRISTTALLCAAAVGLAACGTISRDGTASMPVNRDGGPMLNQNNAIALAGWALQDPALTHGNPERAARAIAAEDWLAGQSMLTPDFGAYSPLGEVSWSQLREQVRAAVGVAHDTPSQIVVDRMLAAANALQAGDAKTAGAQFQPPAFTLGPDGTLAALGNLPQFPGFSWAFADLRHNEDRTFGGCAGKC